MADVVAEVRALTEQLRRLSVGDDDERVGLVEEALGLLAGREVLIEEEEADVSESPENPGVWWAVSAHHLVVGGERVVSWNNASSGEWGMEPNGLPEEVWLVEEGDDAGTDAPLELIEALGLEDPCPDVPVPGEEEEE